MHESHPLFAELTTERLWAITPDALSSLDAMLASSNGKDTAPAPRAAACRRISSTVFRGVHTTTRSMSSGRDSSEGQHFLPNTASRPGLMK